MLEPVFLKLIPKCVQHPNPPITVDDEPKFEISNSIPRSTIAVAPANSFTLSAGQVTKALMKKPLGSLHLNLEMLWN